MQPITEVSAVIASVGETQSFSITESEKAYQLLSDPYSDKPRAVVRELIANAWDAHQMNNCQLPIEVILPTELEPTMSVQDFGPGMSHNLVMQVYTSYFASTKDGENDSIGGLGVGCKSPFSLTDMFNVSSCYKGKRTIYSCYKDQIGKPRISVMSVEDCLETGVTVTFNVPTDNIGDVWSNARTIFANFPIVPNVKNLNFSLNAQRVLLETEHFKIVNGTSNYANRGQSHIASMGYIEYPIAGASLQGFNSTVLTTANLQLNFNIGELEVALSRESLSYDQRTINAIKEKCDIVAAEAGQLLADKFSAMNTPWEAFSVLSDTKRNVNRYNPSDLFRTLFALQSASASQRHPITLMNGGVNISKINMQASVINWINGGNNMRRVWTVESTGNVVKRPQKLVVMRCGDISSIKNAPTANSAFVLHDVKSNISAQVRQFLELNKRKYQDVYILAPNKKDTDNTSLDALLNSIGNPPIIKASELPAIVPDKVSELAGDQITTRSSTGFRYWNTQSNKLLNDGGIYVKSAAGDSYTDSSGNLLNINKLNNLSKIGIIPKNTAIHAINTKNLPKAEKHPKWINLDDVLSKSYDVFVKENHEMLSFFLHIHRKSSDVALQFLPQVRINEIEAAHGPDCGLVKYLNEMRKKYLRFTLYAEAEFSIGAVKRDRDALKDTYRGNNRDYSLSYNDWYDEYMKYESLDYSNRVVHTNIYSLFKSNWNRASLNSLFCSVGFIKELTNRGVNSDELDDMVMQIDSDHNIFKLITPQSIQNDESRAIVIGHLK